MTSHAAPIKKDRRSRRRGPEPFRQLGSGERVLLLHAFGLTWHSWGQTVDDLAKDHEVLALTLGGHWGAPRIPRDKTSIGSLADLVEQAMDKRGWDSAHLVGNSLGGWVSLELAKRGRARSVVGIAPAGGWVPGSADEARFRRLFIKLYPAALLGPLLAGAWVPAVIKRMALAVMCRHPENISPAMATMLLRAPAHFPNYLPFIRFAKHNGPLTGLQRIDVPVRIVDCQCDRVLRPSMVQRYLDELPGVELVELADVGHVPMPEAPHLVAEAIRTHIATSGLRQWASCAVASLDRADPVST